jgi:Mn-dependent DtxR family transcriptional regulator
MPQIMDDNEARNLARLIKNGQLSGAGRDSALAALRDYDARSLAAPSSNTPETAAPDEDEPGILGNVTQLAKRSGARVLGAVPALVEQFGEKASEQGRAMAGITPEYLEALPENERKVFDALDVGKAIADPARAARDKAKQWENDAVAALSPDVQRSIELHLVERDEQGALQVGEGARDPWWWTANAIDMGAMMAPGIGTAGVTARLSYAAKYGEALAVASARKMPQSLAIQYARKEAQKAATRAAVIAGGLTEGSLSGGLNAAQVEDAINELDEQTMMNYEPYRAMREKGSTHEIARAKVATDRGFGVGLATAVATGLTGAPLNAWIARWATKTGPVTSRLKATGQAAALEGGQEFVQEGTEQALANLGEQPITGKDTWEGVLESAITGGVLGGILGGGGAAAAGPSAKTAPKVDESQAKIEQLKNEFDRTLNNLSEAQLAAQDPSIRIAQADIDAAREEHRQSMVALSQTLLQSGKLDAKAQKTVAAALQQAEAAGVKPKVEAKPIQGEVRDAATGKGVPTPVGAGDESRVPPAAKQGTQKAGKPAEAPAQAKAAEALNEAETARHDALNRVATADTLEVSQLNELVSQGLAKANATGRPLLTPAGRRQHKALEQRIAAQEAAETAAKEAAKPAAVAKKPQAKSAPQATKTTAPAKPVAQKAQPAEPAKEPAKVDNAARKVDKTELGESDFVALERLVGGKPVSNTEAAGLERAGLVRRKTDGGYAVKPAGRRELRQYRQSERQTPLERQYQPVVKGKTLRAPRAAEKQAAAVQKDLAFTKRERQLKREQRREEIKRQRDFTAAKNQRADQQVDVAERSATTAEPLQTLGDALRPVQEKAVSTKRGQPPKRGRKEQIENADVFYNSLPTAKSVREDEVGARRKQKQLEQFARDFKEQTRGRMEEIAQEIADANYKFDAGDAVRAPSGRRIEILGKLPPRNGTPRYRGRYVDNEGGEVTADFSEDKLGEKFSAPTAVAKSKTKPAMTPEPMTYEPAERRGQQGFVVKQAGKEAAFVRTEEEAKELTRDPDASETTFRAGTGKGVTDEQINEVRAQIAEELGVDVEVAPSTVHLPQYLRNVVNTKGLKGLFHRSPGGYTELWLIQGNLDSKEDAYLTAVHEAVGHMGLRGLLGRKYNETMRQIRKTFPREVRGAAHRNGIRWGHDSKRAREQHRNLAAEELVAYATERVLAGGAKSKQRSTWAKIVTFFREALRKIGWVNRFSERDIMDLILRARDHLQARGRETIRASEYNAVFYAARAKGDKNAVQFKHFSNLTEDEIELDPKFMGTGIPGRERARGPVPQISLYPDDIEDSDVEEGLKGKTAYVVEVPRDALYDASEDRLQLRMKAQVPMAWSEEDGVRTPSMFRFDANAFDKLVQEHGFDGYYLPAASGILRGQGRLFKSVPARRITDEALARMDDGTTVETQGKQLVVRAEGGGEMRADILSEMGYLWVRYAAVPQEERGTGRGLAMAQRLAREAYSRGLRLASDNRVSSNAVRVYEALARRGYSVKRNPAEENGQGELISASELKPVFEVTGGELAAAVGPAGGRLLGMPHKAAIPGHGTVDVGPFEPAKKAARAYRENMGIDTAEPRTYVRVDPQYARTVARAFDKMKHDPKNPKVKAAYTAMIEETIAQYQEIKKTGLKVEFIEGKDPYAASPRMAIEDVKNNNHLWVFPTDAGFGADGPDAQYLKDNPMLQPTSEKIGDRTLLANDVFRIVHDYFGHIAEGNGFRADGEENAWRVHASMYSPLARAAMTTETRGQNSWLNFGPHGAKNRAAKTEETVFAPQKIGLLPKEFWEDPSAESDEQLSEARQTAQETIRKLAKFLTPAERRKINQGAAKRLVDLFKQLPNEKEMAAAALAGQAKRGWYRKSAEAISNIFGPDAPRFAALLAALSPQTSVEMNLKNTVQVWRGWIKAGRPTDRAGIMKVLGQNVVGHKGGGSVLGAWKNNTVRALTDPDPENVMLSGPKVDSFAANLRGETNAVTLDTWMANFALVEQTIFSGGMLKSGKDPGKGVGYLAYSARVRQTAAYLTEQTGEQWTPAEVQETIWSWAKALYEESEAFGAVGSARDIIENEELTDALINATPDFATLFQNPEYSGILRQAGYGAELERLAGQASNAGAVGKKAPALEGDRQRLLKAAGRLDKLKEQRRSANVAFSILGGNTGDPNLDAFLDKIGGPRRTLKQMWQDWTTDLGDRTALAVFDHLHGIKRAETLAGISTADSGYVSARLAANSAELTQAVLEYGYPVWNDGAADVAGNMGLLGILRPLGDNVNLWLAYMVAKRADRLMTEGRENLFSQTEINAALRLGQSHPEFDVVAQRYADFQSRVLDFAEEAGIIDPAGRALWEHADYIPFYRIIENGEVAKSTSGGALGKVRNQIVKLRGGQENLGDPLENIVRNWLAMMDASLKAQAARLTVDNLNGTGLVTRAPNVEMTQAIIPKAQIKTWIKNNPTLVATLQAVGLDVNKLPSSAFQGLQKMMAVQAPTDEDIISVWRDGKREYWHVHDSLLFQSLQGINAKAWGPLMEIFRYPKRLLTAMVTSTPQFALKNVWRDMWHVFVQGTPKGSKIPLVPGLDTVKGVISQIKMDADSKSILAGGGSFTHGYVRAGQTEGAASTIRRSMRKSGVGGIALNTPAKLWGVYRDLLNASENSHRVAVYNRERARGKSRKEALFEARDMLDFSMRGNNAVVRFLIESVPFMNARMQGLYRLGRGFKTDFAAVAIRGLLLTAATAALMARNFDDERYKELTDAQKNTYWHFWIEDGSPEGVHFKIPKPFEVGTLFGTVPEAIMDAMFTNADEPDAAKQSMRVVGHAFAETLDLSPQVQAVWPILELAINKNSFTGAPILTQGDAQVLPEDQDSPRISPTYRAIAHAMPDVAPEALRSPKQLEHLGRGYLGNLQDYVLLVSDSLVRKARGEPNPPERASADWPGLRDFRTTGPSRHTKYMDAMYDIASEAESVFRSVNRANKQQTDEGDARVEQLETDNEQLLDVRKDFGQSVEQVNELRRQQRAIQLDADLLPEEKRLELDEIQREINEIARDVYDLRPGGKLNPEIIGELIGVTPRQQVRVLKDNGLPGTARLLEEMKA